MNALQDLAGVDDVPEGRGYLNQEQPGRWWHLAPNGEPPLKTLGKKPTSFRRGSAGRGVWARPTRAAKW